MARPETAPKTALAARLREFRKRLGDPDREAFAIALGVSKSTLASYERGESEPTASALSAYREKFGASLNWLLTGQGEIFEDASKAPPPSTTVDLVVLQKLSDTVQAVFVECKQTPPPRAVVTEAGRLYNELLGAVKDIRDRELVDATIKVLRQRFKERIQSAEPGSGKRSAS